jgi:hypothetical protein
LRTDSDDGRQRAPGAADTVNGDLEAVGHMRTHYEGGCLCGSVRYQCTAKPVHVFYCHCRDCQKETGGPFAAEIYVPASSVTIAGPLSRHTRLGDSGRPVHRRFCSNCGTVVLTEFEVDPAYVCVKACSLDDPSCLRPEFHLYVSSRQPWNAIADGLPQYERDF